MANKNRGFREMAAKDSKATISQQRVLDAAARIFRHSGYAGTTMRAVADEAGLQAGSLYYYYKGKDELISAVLDSGMNNVATLVKEALAALPAGASAQQRLEKAIEAHISAIIAVGDYTLATRRVFGQLPPSIRARHMRLRNVYGALWDQLLADGKTSGEFRPEADLKLGRLFLLGALNWTAEWYKPGSRSITDIAQAFSILILNGLVQPTEPTQTPQNPAKSRPRLATRPLRSAGAGLQPVARPSR